MRHNLHECGKRGNYVSLSRHGKKVREQYFSGIHFFIFFPCSALSFVKCSYCSVSGIHFNNLQIISSNESRGTLELTTNFTHV